MTESITEIPCIIGQFLIDVAMWLIASLSMIMFDLP